MCGYGGDIMLGNEIWPGPWLKIAIAETFEFEA